MRKSLIIIPLIALSIGALGQVTPAQTSQPTFNFYKSTARQLNEINAAYPYDISLRTAENDTLLSDRVFAKNGKPTVLLFWLTTCSPCRMEMKAIAEKYEDWQSEADFNLYAISIDWPKQAERFTIRVQEANWPFPAYHDYNREFGVILPGNLNGLPQTFILDKEGEIAHHKRKYRPGDEDHLFALIKSLQ